MMLAVVCAHEPWCIVIALLTLDLSFNNIRSLFLAELLWFVVIKTELAVRMRIISLSFV